MSKNTFLDDLENEMNDDNIAYTENGAMAYATSGSKVLDFFSVGGALRSRDDISVIRVFEKAYQEDPLLAIKALFYFRDIREGQGERNTFRTLINFCASKHPESIRENIGLIAEYGRWDDLYALVDTKLENEIWPIIDAQLAADAVSDNPSLLAKWLPSENTHARKRAARVLRDRAEFHAGSEDLEWYKTSTPRYAKLTRKALNMSSRTYRKLLSVIRKKINLVETAMSTNGWSEVQYDKIPSKAGMQYRKSFLRHDHGRYVAFLDEVKKGTKKINAATLFPYEIIEKTEALGYTRKQLSQAEISALDAMWQSLPDYFNGNGTTGLVVADTSGSMTGRPLQVAISLAIYTAERNTGVFKNKFITFSQRPTMQTVTGDNIVQKTTNLARAHWEMNTNVKAVFDLILNTAINAKAPQEDLPSHLYIVSDMEFDRCASSGVNDRLFDTIRKQYAQAGYEMPFLVFWNVNSRNDQQPMKMDQRGFQLVSGCSPSIFKSLLSNKTVSAYDLMLEVLNQERYNAIRIGE